MEIMAMKTLKSFLAALALVAMAGSSTWLVGCAAESHEHEHANVHEYFCPMHHEVIQAGPGTCPKCGMKLVPKE